jgi:hypothetical protein
MPKTSKRSRASSWDGKPRPCFLAFLPALEPKRESETSCSAEVARMNRAHFVVTAASLVLAGGPVRGVAAAERKRSLWVWQTPLEEMGELATFAQHNGFDPIFLSIVSGERSALEAGEQTSLASVNALRTLKRAGLGVYAVAGDPSWVKHERNEVPETVRKLLAVHHAHGVFDGLALDLEPHTLPEWKDESEKPVLATNYLNVLALVRAAVTSENLPLLATVHPTYAKYSVPSRSGETLLQSAAHAVDATDLMAYRNAESTLESFGGAAMEQLAATAKPWWLGVSTHSKSAPGTSYATLPAAQFFPDINQTADELAKRYGGSFAGISVEDYRNTVALLNQDGAK